MPSAGSQHRNKGLAALRMSLAVALVAAGLTGPPPAGPFEDGTAAYNRGDNANALRIRLELADQGNPAAQGNTLAQNNLGRIAKKENVASGTSSCTMVKIDQWLVKFSRNRWLVIEGAINGQKVGILLDTGAMRTMIFRPVAERLGLMLRPIRNAYVSGVGGISFVESARVDEFKIGESTRRNWHMM